jgi:hypothetical protein
METSEQASSTLQRYVFTHAVARAGDAELLAHVLKVEHGDLLRWLDGGELAPTEVCNAAAEYLIAPE